VKKWDLKIPMRLDDGSVSPSWIKAARMSVGMRQGRLAELLGIHQPQVSRFEIGRDPLGRFEEPLLEILQRELVRHGEK
jgi:DNA-binding transcriptional regulator YiaG